MGVSQDKSLAFDFVIRDALVELVSLVVGIPDWHRKVKMMGDLIVEMANGGMVVIGEVIDPF